VVENIAVMKRLFDLAISSLAIVAMAVPFCLLAFMVRIKLGSPIFFVQERPGLNGGLFRLVKFRTMTDKRNFSGELLPDCDRMTPFGNWMRSASLDELPELFNVLKGDMSLVGPRPLLREYLESYNEVQARRHEVRPGLTGWAQVNGRNDVSWEDRLSMDVWYVDNRNFWLDFKIFWMTLGSVLNRKGISAPGHVTMPVFQGGESHEDINEEKK